MVLRYRKANREMDGDCIFNKIIGKSESKNLIWIILRKQNFRIGMCIETHKWKETANAVVSVVINTHKRTEERNSECCCEYCNQHSHGRKEDRHCTRCCVNGILHSHKRKERTENTARVACVYGCEWESAGIHSVQFKQITIANLKTKIYAFFWLLYYIFIGFYHRKVDKSVKMTKPKKVSTEWSGKKCFETESDRALWFCMWLVNGKSDCKHFLWKEKENLDRIKCV